MEVVHRSVVLPEEIDSLGHMNARFYFARMARANEALMRSLGLDQDALAATGAVLTRVDNYVRFQREQRLGARLDVASSVVGLGETGLRVFHEVRNADTGDLAAMMLAELALERRSTRERLELPPGALRLVEAALEPVPDHGWPRSLTLDPPNRDVTFERIFARIGEHGDAATGNTPPRTIAVGECDEHGFQRDDLDGVTMNHRQDAPAPGESFGPQVMVSPSGMSYGWALMELRALTFARPRLGDHIRTIGAIIGLRHKARHTRRWTFNMATGDLLAIDDTIALLLDVEARRAIDVPDDLRAALASLQAPEFA